MILPILKKRELISNITLEGITGMTSDLQNPVIPLGVYDAYIREIGNVIETPNAPYKYAIVYTAYQVYHVQRSVFLAGSDDFITWHKYNNGHPFILNAEDPYLIRYNNKYYIYHEDLSTGTEVRIKCHSSNNIDQGWVDEGIVLTGSGVEGSFDEGAVASPIMFYENGYFYLFYEAARGNFGNSAPYSIGLAKSTNPITGFQRVGDGMLYNQDMSQYWTLNFIPDDLIKINNTYYLIFHGSVKTSPNNLKSGIIKSSNIETGWQDSTEFGLTSDLDLMSKTLNTAMFGVKNGRLYFFIYGSGDNTGILIQENLIYNA